MKYHQIKQSGFTLLELMIALALGLIITAAAIQLILGSFITTKLQDANGQIQDGGLFGLDYIIRDVQLLNFGNTNRYEMKANTSGGGVVLSASNISATTVNNITLDNLVTQSNGESNMSGIESDQLTIQFVAPTVMFNCEGVSVRAGDLVVQRYYLRGDTNQLSLVCDANTPSPLRVRKEIIVPGEDPEKDNPPQSAPSVLNGLGADAQIIIPRVDQFKVLLGGMDANGSLAYYDISTFKTKANLKVVALKLSVLVRSESVVSNQNVNPTQNFNLFGISGVAGLSGQLTNTTATNQIPRQIYIATVALRNGLGKNND